MRSLHISQQTRSSQRLDTDYVLKQRHQLSRSRPGTPYCLRGMAPKTRRRVIASPGVPLHTFRRSKSRGCMREVGAVSEDCIQFDLEGESTHRRSPFNSVDRGRVFLQCTFLNPEDPEALEPNHFLLGSSTSRTTTAPCDEADR